MSNEVIDLCDDGDDDDDSSSQDAASVVEAIQPAPNAAATTTTSSSSYRSHHVQQGRDGGESVEANDEEDDEDTVVEWFPLIDLSDDTHLYCKIVGIRYYRGVAHPGEYVTLVREPSNPYDSNAVRVVNMGGEKVGHVKRELAAILSPLMARLGDALKLDGTIPGRGNQWELPLRLRLYGASPSDGSVAREFDCLAFNAKASARAGGAATATSVVVRTRTLDWKDQQKQLDALFDAQQKEKLALLPDVVLPACLTSTLLEHQLTGVRWLVGRERNSGDRPFWKPVQEGKATKWFCEITRSSQTEPPKPVQGGILADDMGLGKTLQTLALLLVNPPPGRDYTVPMTTVEAALPSTAEPVDLQSTQRAPKKPSKSDIKLLKLSVLQVLAAKAGLSRCTGLKKDSLVQAVLQGLDCGTLSIASYYETVATAPTAAVPTTSSKTKATTTVQSSPTTLIVCPVSVMSNWQEQIRTHVAPDTLRVAVYYGADRHDMLDRCRDVDVLIASYNTLQFDYTPPPKLQGSGSAANAAPAKAAKRQRRSTSIFDIPFYRVVLDEAHTIRNSNSRTFQAVAALQAQHRLCLTGTPLQNKPDDIQSLFQFLLVEPFAQRDIFRRSISQPIRDGQGADTGLALLRALMSHYALRRHKTTVSLELPPKTVELRFVEHPPQCPHGAIHRTLYDSAKAALRASIADPNKIAQGLSAHSASIFEILMRLRQACCSGKLVPRERLERAEQVLDQIQRSGDALTPEEAAKLLDKLKGALHESESGEGGTDAGVPPECAICMESMGEDCVVVLRNCGHVFCQACLTRVAASTDCYGDRANKCPFCRQAFASSDMVPWMAASRAAATQSQDSTELTMSERMGQLGPSPKLQALLQSMAEMQPGEKGVIFSQFTKFLDEIGTFLEAQGKTFTRIDGSMSALKRTKAMQAFSTDTDHKSNESPEFILCSLHAAGTGINLTRANHVFLMDTWWNGSVENQAFDRVHRIGQTRSVRVVRFVTADSIESRMVDLQEQKALTAKGAFENLSADDKKKARFGDIQRLLEL